MSQFPSINERNRPNGLFKPHIPGQIVPPKNGNKLFPNKPFPYDPYSNGPDFNGPDFNGPNFNCPNFNYPNFNYPNFNCPNFNGPDYFPDFSVKIDIVAESIQLALNTFGMTKAEYNSISIQDLNSQKKINCEGNSSCALNILIYYKQNKSFLPQFSPIKHKITGIKIYPELNKFDDVV